MDGAAVQLPETQNCCSSYNEKIEAQLPAQRRRL
jgi:hypothetical protein